MVKYYYCNLCGTGGEYEHGSMPRLCPNCQSEKRKLYYTYERRPPESFPGGRRIKKLCIERDGAKCVLCGSTEKIGVHHKDGNSWDKVGHMANNKLDNLVCLCHSCHQKLHHQQGDIPKQPKHENTLKLLEYHAEHPEIRQARLAKMFGISRERVGQILGRIRKSKSPAS